MYNEHVVALLVNKGLHIYWWPWISL